MARNKSNYSKKYKKRPRRSPTSVTRINSSSVKTGYVKRLPAYHIAQTTSIKITFNVILQMNQSHAPYIGLGNQAIVVPNIWLAQLYDPYKEKYYMQFYLSSRSVAVAACAKLYGLDMYDASVQKFRIYRDLQYSIQRLSFFGPAKDIAHDIGMTSGVIAYDANNLALGRSANFTCDSSITDIPYGSVSSPEAVWNSISSTNPKDNLVGICVFNEAMKNVKSSAGKTRLCIGHLVATVHLNLSAFEGTDNSADSIANRALLKVIDGSASAAVRSTLENMSLGR